MTQASLGNACDYSFLRVNYLPHKVISGDTSYYRMLGKQADPSFLGIIGPRAMVPVEGCTKKLQANAWDSSRLRQ